MLNEPGGTVFLLMRAVSTIPVNGGGKDPSQHKNRRLLDELSAFGPRDKSRLRDDGNVPLLARDAMFAAFVQTLRQKGTSVDYGIL